MTPARYETRIVRLVNNDNKFYTYGRKLMFDGYKKIYQHYEDKVAEKAIDLSNMKHHATFASKLIEIKEHTSLPPPRFNQASLIKALDEAGVGRPSTFKSMANTAVERGYARLENRAYVMLPTGNHVIEGLQKFFPEIVDKDFTKEMEAHLDDIASKDEKWKE
jgi:DNA topoisomerase-1